MTDIGDIVEHRINVYVVRDIEKKDGGYLFHLLNLQTSATWTWFEPWAQQLNPAMFQTLS